MSGKVLLFVILVFVAQLLVGTDFLPRVGVTGSMFIGLFLIVSAFLGMFSALCAFIDKAELKKVDERRRIWRDGALELMRFVRMTVQPAAVDEALQNLAVAYRAAENAQVRFYQQRNVQLSEALKAGTEDERLASYEKVLGELAPVEAAYKKDLRAKGAFWGFSDLIRHVNQLIAENMSVIDDPFQPFPVPVSYKDCLPAGTPKKVTA